MDLLEIATARLPLLSQVYVSSTTKSAVVGVRLTDTAARSGTVLQAWIERESDVVPIGNFSYRPAVLRQACAFQITEMSDVVGRTVRTYAPQRRLFGARQFRAAGKHKIEHDAAPFIRLSPQSEIPHEPVAQHAAGLSIGPDRQSDGRRRSHVGRAPHPPAITLPQDARDRRQLRTAARDV